MLIVFYCAVYLQIALLTNLSVRRLGDFKLPVENAFDYFIKICTGLFNYIRTEGTSKMPLRLPKCASKSLAGFFTSLRGMARISESSTTSCSAMPAKPLLRKRCRRRPVTVIMRSIGIHWLSTPDRPTSHKLAYR